MNTRQRERRRNNRITREALSTYIPSEYDRDYLSDAFPTEQRELLHYNQKYPALL